MTKQRNIHPRFKMPNKLKEDMRVIRKDSGSTLTVVNGCLSATTLKKLFSKAAGLVYTRENDNILLDFDTTFGIDTGVGRSAFYPDFEIKLICFWIFRYRANVWFDD